TPVLGFNFSTNSVPTSTLFNGTYGFQFQVTTPVTVTALAAFNPNAPAGIPGAPYVGGDVYVKLWTEAGTLVASATITNGTLPMAGTFFSATSITPIVLQPGIYRIGSDSYYPYSYVSVFPGYDSASGLTYLYSCDASAPGPPYSLGYPDDLHKYGDGSNHTLPFSISANIVVVLPPPTPVITSDGNLTTVYWPAAAGNFTLQTTTDLTGTNWTAISTNWTTVFNSTAFVGATMTNTTPQAFFRLLQAQ
ncbi:MAG TPA: hypothetical protein VK815_08420, partial [Candidatus Acidoferrales bacterium]|nr:hypothetical protein [Candidatus Acidoferrales bacterium]